MVWQRVDNGYAIHNPATGRYGPKLHGQAQHANRKLNDEFINETLITRQMEYEQNQIVSQRREMDMSYQSYEYSILEKRKLKVWRGIGTICSLKNGMGNGK